MRATDSYKFQTLHKAKRHSEVCLAPSTLDPWLDRNSVARDVPETEVTPLARRDYLWPILWIAGACVAYGLIAWGMGWLP
jgi:hypothetical protein